MSTNKQAINEQENREAYEEQFDTSDPQQVNKAKKRAARTRADRLEFVNAAMQHEQGRAWFYDILAFCKIFSTPYSSDPYDTAFKLGMQNLGLRVMADIQDAAPKEYLLMITEARQGKK